jgi:hypothetical protein
MSDPTSIALIVAGVLLTLAFASVALLKAWNGWLEFKRLELAAHGGGDVAMPPLGGRIELADLKERVRKLEAIAAGIDHKKAVDPGRSLNKRSAP